MRANGFRCRLLLAGAVGFLAALGSACDLNPQPQPPGSGGSGFYTPTTPAEPAIGTDGGGGASSGGTLTLGEGGTPLSPPYKSDAAAGDAAFSASADATAAGDAQESGSSPDASAEGGDAASDADAAPDDGPCPESGE